MFTLSARSLEGRDLAGRLRSPKAGACVSFVGRVRNSNRGRRVTKIDYEAAAAPARREFEKIVRRLKTKHDVYDIRCVHRTGTVRVGEIAVWVGVTAAHRRAAFAACEDALNLLKKRLPIWKKEHYAGGKTAWLGLK